MERALMMVVHSVIIGLLLYVFMVFALKQNNNVAETRSVLIAAIVLIYMVVFGHGLPSSINKHLLL
tara:strand:+ start:65 stop:262 length:198 start_codon:yes stop_codon:yes gene_type:complete